MKNKFFKIILPAILTFLVATPVFAASVGRINSGNIYTVKNITQGTAYTDPVSATCGNTVGFRGYLHNPGNDPLQNVVVKTTLDSGKSNTFTSNLTVSADNANPNNVTDTATVNLDRAANLQYVAGSAELQDANGAKLRSLGDDLFSSGVNIGTVGVSTQQVRYVKFSAQVVCDPTPPQPDPEYTCSAVGIENVTRTKFNLSNTYTAKNGAVYKDTTYVVTDPNGGKTTQTTAGTYTYENTKVGPYSVVATSNFIVNGQTVSDTNKGCEGVFEVEAPPAPVDPEYICNAINIDKTSRTTFQFTTDYTVKDTTYLNITYVITGPNTNETKISTAADGGLYYNQNLPGTYTVTATLNTTDGHNTSTGCAKTFVVEPEPVENVAICKILTANKTVVKIGQTDPAVNFRVYPEYRGNVTFNGSWMDFGDGAKTDLLNIVNYTHTYTAAGTYTAKAYVNFQVDDMVYDVTSVDCELPILVIAADEKCPIPGKEDLDKDDPRCKPDPEMCKIPGLENLPANDPRCKLPADMCKVPGKEYLPANDPRCVPDRIDHCKVPGLEYLPANDPKCVSQPINPSTPTTPTSPSTLPATGAEAFGIVGLGSLVTSAGYYLTSRRRLGKI
jgi:hypothetical protein